MVHKENILVYLPNWLGDILFTTPALFALKQHFKNSHLACIVPSLYQNLLEHQSYIDEVIAMDDRSFFQKAKLIRELRKKKWQRGYLFHRSKMRAQILSWSGVSHLEGYNTNRRAALLARAIPEPLDPLHKMDHWLEFLKKEDIETPKTTYVYDFPKRELKLSTPYFVFHPGSNWSPKQWPTAHFIQLAELLLKKKKVSFVITGLKKDAALAQSIKDVLNPHVVNLVGQTDFTDLANIFSQSEAVIAGDTGPMHLACASQAKVVALYAPTSPVLNGPKVSKNVKIVWEPSQKMNEIHPERVFASLTELGCLA